MVFVLGYRDGEALYGVWKLRKNFMPGGWSKEQSEDSDIVFVTLVFNAALKNIQHVVGPTCSPRGRPSGPRW
ncbi:hypothetical protein ACSCBZ_41510 [Streptomyces niveiscabiei]|uniref:hypothetical protein n=1 Tax=Streptomyces niveiscabiei TaxID=164115 RepID=UPI000AD139C6|nr:hypothetical protein [Streptomyces niveiscabiei]